MHPIKHGFFAVLLALLSLCIHPCPAAAQNDTPSLTLTAVGDILLDRGVGRKIDANGLDYPFAQVATLLAAADIAFGNLECPLAAQGTKVVKPFCFKVPPERAQCLSAAGLDMLSLANNHTLDCGRSGLVETMDELARRGLHWCGAGANQAGAQAATMLDIKGIKVAFVGFCQFLPEGVFWRDDRPTIAFLDEAALRRAVMAARRQADVVVVSLHWGIEYAARPRETQIHLAHVAVAAGADLVLGHHPHVVQGFEVIPRLAPDGFEGRRPALIAYSLGNFVFDPPAALPRAADSVLLRCTLSRAGVTAAQIVPVRLEDCRPRPATPAESTALLNRLASLSAEMKTRLSGNDIVLDTGA